MSSTVVVPSCAPAIYRERVIAAFSDAETPAYGQVATVDAEGRPQVRTVHLHYLPEREALGFNSHHAADKWKQLQQRPVLSGCYVDLAQLVQWRWEGRVELLSGGNAPDDGIIERIWRWMRPDVRSAYWSQHLYDADNHALASDVDIERHCPTCCTVLCFPTRWDIYEINPLNYREGRRTIHRLTGAEWYSEAVSLLFTR